MPTFDCVERRPGGKRAAIFGYENRGSEPVTVPAGWRNRVSVDLPDGFQPTTFLPGKHRRVFAVEFRHRPPSWKLGWRRATGEPAPAMP